MLKAPAREASGTKRRKAISSLMTGLTAACAAFTIVILLIILGYIAVRGLSSINFQFLIDTPKPVGEGGGIGNAIVGLFVLGVLNNGLDHVNIDSFLKILIRGLILLAALIINVYAQRLRNAQVARAS